MVAMFWYVGAYFPMVASPQRAYIKCSFAEEGFPDVSVKCSVPCEFRIRNT